MATAATPVTRAPAMAIELASGDVYTVGKAETPLQLRCL
jgi:hypothetical protein